MKKIFLKEWVRPMAELHAICVVEDLMGLSENDPKYQKEFEKAFHDFCLEFYEHSLIPHAANPTVPAGKNVFDVFQKDFMDNLKAENDEIKKELYSQITRSVSMISRVLVESEMGKMKYDLNGIQGEKEEKTKKIHDSVRNRYKRMIFICLIMGHVKSMFKLRKGEIDNFVDSLLASEKWRSLQSTPATKDFASKIKSAVESDMKDYSPLDSVKKEFKK
jgi:hypothetical protein